MPLPSCIPIMSGWPCFHVLVDSPTAATLFGCPNDLRHILALKRALRVTRSA